jgi:hypothetical protein
MPTVKRKNARKAVAPLSLGAADRALLDQLAQRTKLSAGEVVARALASYAAAVAPELAAPVKTIGKASAKPAKRPRLYFSLDGGKEREADRDELVIGRDPASDVHLDLPLIADRHARLKLVDGRWLFEDLRSPRGSFKGGQRLEVAFLADGDEIDLGGFLPMRFRLVGA